MAADDGAGQGGAENEALVVPVEGDLDFGIAAETRDRLLRLVTHGRCSLVVDLAGCTYIDSSGMLALIAAGHRAAGKGGSVRLQNASPLLIKMLRFSRLGEVLGVPGSAAPPPRPRQPVPDTGVGQWDVLRIVQPALPQSTALVRRAIVDEASVTPLSDQDCADIELAVGEAFANAVRHGSPRGDHDVVTVRALRGANAFVAEISDSGNGFDSSRLARPDPDEVREGGLGVFYMRMVMDSVEFESGPHGTTVRLVKRYPTSP